MLRQPKEKRKLKHNLMLASSTAFVAGVTNVASLLAFLTFTSNVTGHVANLAKNIVEQDFHEILIFVLWLFLFFAGAFVSSFIIKTFYEKSPYRAHSIPIIVEIVVLCFVAFYGDKFYKETQAEREVAIGALIFAMGLQNSLASNISGGLIKSTHLTGLFTDLGSEVAEWLHPRTVRKPELSNKIYVRLTILGFYIFGGFTGGFFFELLQFHLFYFIPLVLLTILFYDLVPIIMHRVSRFLTGNSRGKTSNI